MWGDRRDFPTGVEVSSQDGAGSCPRFTPAPTKQRGAFSPLSLKGKKTPHFGGAMQLSCMGNQE